MTPQLSLEELRKDLKNIHQSHTPGVEGIIEKYLEEQLKNLSCSEGLLLLEKLAESFQTKGLSEDVELKNEELKEENEFSRFICLLLGEEIPLKNLSSTEVMEKLAPSLNIIFNTLNQIIELINSTLFGRKTELETIRHIIGASFEEIQDDTQFTSLQNYLDQIKEAFLISHQSFTQSVQTKIGQILQEIAPERLEAESPGRFKIGPLRKAELFELYKQKYQTCLHWLNSERSKEDFLREFEKTCQKIYREKRR